MAIDLDAIKSKLAELKERGGNSGGNPDKWKPQPGEYRVRVLPWPDQPAGEPFPTRQFYYNIARYGIVAPAQFGKPDPVDKLRRSLFEDGTEAAKETAKKLFPRLRGYARIIVRDDEEAGVKLWDFPPSVHEGLLELFLEDGVGDYTDPSKDGIDIRVKVVSKSNNSGRSYFETKVDVPRGHKNSPLSDNAKQAKEWLATTFDIEEKWPLKSYDEIKELLDAWVNGTDADADTSSSGTELNTSATKPSADADDEETKSETSAKAEKDIDDVLNELGDD